MTEQLYCDVPDCDREVAGHGRDKCPTHLKQLQRTGHTKPITEKLSPEERAIEAGTRMLEAEDDDEYSTHRRAWLQACKALGAAAADRMADLGNLAEELRRKRSSEVSTGMAAARARGVRLGRPPRHSDEELKHWFTLLGSGALVARALRMHPASVNERLARIYGKRRISSSETPRATPSGPREA